MLQFDSSPWSRKVERYMVAPLFLFGQQFATAVAWMCLMGTEKGTEWIEKAQNT